MTLQLKMAAQGNLDAFMAARAKGVASAVTRAVRAITFGLQREIIRQVKKANFKKDGLQKTIKAKVNPRRGYLPDAEGLVYSVARVNRGGMEIDLIESYDKGVTITAKGGKWLAIPTLDAPHATGRGSANTRARPSRLSSSVFKLLTFIPTNNTNVAMLVFTNKQTGEKRVAYWLVKKVTMRKRLDINRAKQKWLPKLEPRINRNLDRYVYKTGDDI